MSLSYDRLAEAYDELYGEEQRAKYSIILENIRGVDVVLDAGCGTGLIASMLGECYYVGLDRSKGMLAKAKRSVTSLPADLVRGDVEAMPFRREGFTHVFSVTVFHEAPGLLAEAFRVLKGGGVLAVTLLRKRGSMARCLLAYRPVKVVDRPEVKDIVFFFEKPG